MLAASKSDSFMWLSSKHIILEGESTLIRPSSVKYYSRMEESDSNPDLTSGDDFRLQSNVIRDVRTLTAQDGS